MSTKCCITPETRVRLIANILTIAQTKCHSVARDFNDVRFIIIKERSGQYNFQIEYILYSLLFINTFQCHLIKIKWTIIRKRRKTEISVYLFQ